MKTRSKRLLSLLIALCMTVVLVPRPAIASGTLPGDLNGDRQVNNVDLVMLARYVARLDTLSDGQLAAADLSGRGRCDNTDLVMLARRVAGLSVQQILNKMSLRDKLAQMMFFSPRQWLEDGSYSNVTVLSDEMRQYISEHRYGGMLLFGGNCVDAEQTLRLSSALSAATVDGGGIAPLVAADQEGGYVARFDFGTTGVGNMALGATDDPECAREMSRIFGEEMQSIGINVDLAPVVDVSNNPRNPDVGVRSFGDDPEYVGTFGVSFMRGLWDTDTVACVKHFPGHGNTDTDSHTGLALVERTYDELMEGDLLPFKMAVDAGADMVMTAHIQYPGLDNTTYKSISTGEDVYVPATLSKTILTGILREQFGFDGVIVSDSIVMQSLWDHFATDDILSMSINAGVNMLVMPTGGDSWGMTDTMLTRAVELAEEGIIDIDRINDSVLRILKLKEKYGLLDKTDFDVTEGMAENAKDICGSEEHAQKTWDIACKGLTLLKNDNGALPLSVKGGEKILLLSNAASRRAIGELSSRLLKDMGVLPEDAEIDVMITDRDTEEACKAAAREADHVIFISRAPDIEYISPSSADGYAVKVYNDITEELHAAGKPAIVISAQLPYDAACFPNADAILLTYFCSYMTTVPNRVGEGSAWAPNLPAAICAVFGGAEPTGKLPVNIPKLDVYYNMTDDILYYRQTGKK